jgi:hypothetical protein
MANPNYVMRTVLISPEVDNQLRTMAFKENKSKNDIIRGFLEVGLGTAAAKETVVRKIVKKKAAAKKVAAKKVDLKKSGQRPSSARSAAAHA